MSLYREYLVIALATTTFFINGIVIGWNTPSVELLRNNETSIIGYAATDAEISVLTSLTFFGVFAVLTTGTLCDVIGRKYVMLLCPLINIVSFIVLSTASNIYVICFARLVGTQGCGFGYVATIIYLSEIVSVPIRGFALTVTGFLTNIGVLVAVTLGPLVSMTLFAYICLALSGLCFIFIMMLPESPVHCVLKGKINNSNKIRSYLKQPHYIEEEVTSIMENSCKKEDQFSTDKFKMIFTIKRNMKAFSIITIIYILQGFSGYNSIMVYMMSIFLASGSSVSPYIATVTVSLIQLFPCMVSSMIVDRIGRKFLLIASSFITALANFLLGLQIYLEQVKSPIVQHTSWLPLVCLVAYVLFYWIGLGVIPVGLAGELLDQDVKSVASSLACAIELIIGCLVIAMFEPLNSVIGRHGTFWLFSICGFVTTMFVSKFLPETKGKTFGEIQRMLD